VDAYFSAVPVNPASRAPRECNLLLRDPLRLRMIGISQCKRTGAVADRLEGRADNRRRGDPMLAPVDRRTGGAGVGATISPADGDRRG
jgi:hypothetical protein